METGNMISLKNSQVKIKNTADLRIYEGQQKGTEQHYSDQISTPFRLSNTHFGNQIDAQINDLAPNEENLLDQTLGQTLTQQKLILDEINKQTKNKHHMQSTNKFGFNGGISSDQLVSMQTT